MESTSVSADYWIHQWWERRIQCIVLCYPQQLLPFLSHNYFSLCQPKIFSKFSFFFNFAKCVKKYCWPSRWAWLSEQTIFLSIISCRQRLKSRTFCQFCYRNSSVRRLNRWNKDNIEWLRNKKKLLLYSVTFVTLMISYSTKKPTQFAY